MRLKRVALSVCFLFFDIQSMDSFVDNSAKKKELNNQKVIAYQRALEEEIIKITEESAAINVQLYRTKDHNRFLLRQQSLEEELLQEVKLESVEAGLKRMIIALASDYDDQSFVELIFMKEIDLLLNGTEDIAKWLGLNEYKQ